MPDVGIVKSIAGSESRLVVSGGWSAEAASGVANGNFDRLEFHGGEYDDFGFLEPYKDKIASLSILSGKWSGAEGLENLTALRSFVLGVSLKGVDFSRLSRLESLSLGAWTAGYSKKLLGCRGLKSLHIEGFSESTCDSFGGLTGLESLSLARGKLATLAGLAKCARLRVLQLAHLRKLEDVAEIGRMPSLREVELVEALPLVRDVDAVTASEQLRRLDLRGVNVVFDDISWLKEMRQLNVLGLRNIRSPDWEAVFASRELKKVAIAFEKPPRIALDDVRAEAVDHGLAPTSVKALGVPSKPVGFVIEFRPEGSTQNLWFWKRANE